MANLIEQSHNMQHESERTQMVQDCETLQQLYKVFDELVLIQGSRKEFTADMLKGKIEYLKKCKKENHSHNQIPWNLLTRTHGIRAKVMELFWYNDWDGTEKIN